MSFSSRILTYLSIVLLAVVAPAAANADTAKHADVVVGIGQYNHAAVINAIRSAVTIKNSLAQPAHENKMEVEVVLYGLAPFTMTTTVPASLPNSDPLLLRSTGILQPSPNDLQSLFLPVDADLIAALVQEIDAAEAAGVKIVICQTAITTGNPLIVFFGFSPVEFISPKIGFVPNGPTEIISRQAEGWLYVYDSF